MQKHSARKLRQAKCANIEWSRQLAFDIQDTASQFALAPRFQQAGGREWQWRMSRGNLSSLLASDITNFVQRGTYTMLG